MEKADSIVVHSPKTHYHSQTAASFMESRPESSGSSTSKSDTGSKSDAESDVRSNFSESGESDISDMIVDSKSRFEKLNEQRRKSGGSDYRPASDSNNESSNNSKSEQESESEESESEGSCVEPSRSILSKNKKSSARVSEEDSEGTTSRSTSCSLSQLAMVREVKQSPLVRKSPLGLGQRSSPKEVTMMRGYRYSMLPSRTAAMNVSYRRYLAADEEDDSEDSLTFSRNKKKGRGNQRMDDSDSEFEVPGINDDSSEEEVSLEEESEDEYYPAKRKARGGRRRKV